MTAKIMYAEAGSLRELRGEIRRAPDFDPALEMISGQGLFLFDQRGRTGLLRSPARWSLFGTGARPGASRTMDL